MSRGDLVVDDQRAGKLSAEQQLAEKMDVSDFKQVADVEQAIDDQAVSHQQFKVSRFVF